MLPDGSFGIDVNETLLPRILALILLVVSLAMLAPLGFAVAGLVRGEAVATMRWAIPLTFLATGSALTVVLARRPPGFQLYVTALAFWLIGAGYYFFRILA